MAGFPLILLFTEPNVKTVGKPLLAIVFKRNEELEILM